VTAGSANSSAPPAECWRCARLAPTAYKMMMTLPSTALPITTTAGAQTVDCLYLQLKLISVSGRMPALNALISGRVLPETGNRRINNQFFNYRYYHVVIICNNAGAGL
jgi:hypothetical protein